MSEVREATVEELRAEAQREAQQRLRAIEEREHRYDTDFEAFAGDCLTIRPEQGGDMLLRLNEDQKLLHREIEDQRRRIGKVRKLIVKARKVGCSTYVEGRFYWKTSRGRGRKAFILTQIDDATANIFAMTERYHRHNPHAPHTGKSNAKELYFDEIDSGIVAATAGSRGIGRSDTIQYFHGSEVAIWPHADVHAAGVLEAIPDVPGTEIILESTANGIGGLFYNMVQSALRKQGQFEVIFLAWYTHKAYSRPAPKDWRPPPEFVEYAVLHKLTRDQLYWAYTKNADLAARDNLSADEISWKFRQEFPSTIDEAFRASRMGRFIRSELVIKARKFIVASQAHAPIILGCDFACGGAGEGGDSNVFIDRQGRRAGGRVYDRFNDHDTVSVANRLGATIERIKPAMCFLDTGGGGAQVYDILVSRNFGPVLTLVNFGATARDDRKYANKRAEMWGNGRDWLADPGGAQIPDCDVLDGELTAPKGKEDLNQRLMLERKEVIRKEFGKSPDGADALMLTHAEPVRRSEFFSGMAPTGGGDSTVGY